jgi:radical SAM protein with 4Fe4S-binding SPASM domain
LFSHDGRDYAHVSAVPLTYLRLSPGLAAFLDTLRTPHSPAELLGDRAGPSEAAFIERLLRAGVLRDAGHPDPIHDLRPAAHQLGTLYLYPTNSCNLRCVYCYATSGPGAGPRLSPEHALMAVDDFFDTVDPQVRAVRLRFHGGGEPTTNFGVMASSWQHFALRARDAGLPASVSTITNATFGPAVLRSLLAQPWSVLVSYDGPRQAAQRPTATHGDSRDRVVANIQALMAAGKQVSVRATLTRDGVPFMRDVVDDAVEVGIRHVQVEAASMVGRGANLLDGPPRPEDFASAFLDAFDYALRADVRLTTAAWSHTRVGDGRYCAAVSGMRALTPDGYVSACTEACEGSAGDPFIIGTLDTVGRRLQIWPAKEDALQRRIGYDLPHCSTCYMVDTCGGGCMSRARAESGDAFARDSDHCVVSRTVNPRLMADLADGRLLPDEQWQPFTAELPSDSVLAGRMVALVPPFARAAWNRDPSRRPAFPIPASPSPFFHLPA